ncbi:MAG: deoxyribodipyrimidine photo-lyase, partial [Chloroflexi bacterium]|nr:deoxyribodipyrimidine photo-lyase [Chloroflexota bacterium]
NWQWSASTGTDAAPYFRIFNPINQSTKFDKAGNYIRTWVTELLNVNDKFIHQPWFMNRKEQNRSNCHIGKDYPFPIVDLAKSRYRALNAFDN